ncbi:flavin-containing monooxygenase [Methylobacterium isbiliense]|uniref:FAD-containing monooxygenase EthA n=1 Tax=Methylobacterium isbiliense TaxID=315478 RepID=A0ABQ4SQ45_9HYPH|nr:NAD(P)/FAD-dependent oxidoreductase [Methylobacterium isbiliense]MDN3626552.1 NAD(P)/FAD-dependent oxidoreductase [Methylobacterium isbiliense]GJE03953.1 FAD-containing monooxygenase EthA [Methylobacterium isbiliense]
MSPSPAPSDLAATRDLDVLVVGAGISGISAGHALQTRCPTQTYAILEAREAIGGTWDLFRYPGLRSDSDLYTFGFSFRPWSGDKSIADGPAILRYLRETAAAYGIDRKIRYRHRVLRADWRSQDARWSVAVQVGDDPAPVRFTCRFLSVCAGYYDYDEGYRPDWPGTERFAGPIVHPQAWPEDLDYAGKRVVVIGSGATAVTLVPEMATRAAHVTMLQRSPSYVLSMPAADPVATWLRRYLPARLAHGLARWKNVFLTLGFYQFARRKPDWMARQIIALARRQLGPDYDVATHFTPAYKPWDQRLCLVPDGDLFRAIRSGRASVVTDRIESFTPAGLQLASGRHLDADIVVAATGLKLRMLGGLTLTVDGRPVEAPATFLYRGMMLSDVPNLAVAIGYTNASWTLKCELTARFVCRLINRMEARGDEWCVPRRGDAIGEAPLIDFTSGYIQRARDLLPKQGARKPWRLYQNYLLDLATLRFGSLEDGALEFGRRPPAERRAA